MQVYTDEIRELVLRFFHSRNCSIEFTGEETIRVVLSDELSVYFDNRRELHLTFSPETDSSPDSSAITAGAPSLSVIREILREKGFLGTGYLHMETVDIYERMGKIPESVTFENCTAVLDGSGIEYAAVGRFLFHLVLHGEEKREELIPIFLDVETGRELYPVPEILHRSPLREKPPLEGWESDQQDPRTLYDTAEKCLRSRIAPVLANLSREISGKIKDEQERMRSHFDYLILSARTGEEKESLNESLSLRLKDIEERYRPYGSVSLANLTKILVPRIFYRIKLEKNGKISYLDLKYDYTAGKLIPLPCPGCGEETENFMICETHGIDCGRGGWFCPVCDVDRCSRCESIVCAIDNRKKDPGCTFRCSLCNLTVGIDHQVQCGVCGITGCEKCIRTNKIDNTPICPNCGYICYVCGKTFSTEERTVCEICLHSVCTVCNLRVCSRCGMRACLHDTFTCIECNKVFCKRCSGGVDVVDGGTLCRNCAIHCTHCKRVIRPLHSTTAAESGKLICLDCSRTCVRCNHSYYKGNISRCSICKEYVCPKHTLTCPSCGGHTCREHAFECITCGMEYCSRCKGKGSQNSCTLCNSLQPLKTGPPLVFARKHIGRMRIHPLSNWKFAEGSEIYVYSNTFALSSYLIVASKRDKHVIGSRRVSFLERIRDFLRGE